MCGPNITGRPYTAGSRMLCPPGGHEAAAHEHHRAHLVHGGQLANRVEHDDVGARLGVDRQVVPANGAEALLLGQPHDLVEAFRVPGREHAARPTAARS